jgi:hypothetical protein
MANISEDSYQIARYLLENHHLKGGKPALGGDVRASLNNVLSDFDAALNYLFGRGYCRNESVFLDHCWLILLPAGIDFVESVERERINIGSDAEQLLKYLVKDQSPDLPFSIANAIMKHLEWNEERYTEAAQVLCDEGFVKGQYADGNPFSEISLLPDGRKIVRANFRKPSALDGAVYTGNITANISGNNNLVTIGSVLSAANQTIQVSSAFTDTDKAYIQILLEELNQLLQNVPDDLSDDSEAVAEMAKTLVENATKDKPNKRMFEITVEGLRKAATNIAVITPPVLTTVRAIIAFIEKLPR